jgi:peptidyl-prolyl cis-trans isomerase C
LFEKLRQLVREPLVHFLLIGAGIYVLYGMFGAGTDENDERTVTVTSGNIQALSDQWRRTWNRPPTEEELANIVRNFARMKVLHREALAMGLDKGDTVIERRLAQKVEFLAKGLITPEEPSDEILIDRYTENQDRFKQPDLYTITQIFFDPDKRGRTTDRDAKAMLDELVALDKLPSNISEHGDRLMLENYYPSVTLLELDKRFGPGFAEEIVKLQPGSWQGPVRSGFGIHLVLVNDVVIFPPPAFEDIKEQLIEEWMTEQINELSERFIDGLISRYEVIVEETEVPISIPGSGASQ